MPLVPAPLLASLVALLGQVFLAVAVAPVLVAVQLVPETLGGHLSRVEERSSLPLPSSPPLYTRTHEWLKRAPYPPEFPHAIVSLVRSRAV